MSSPWDTTLDEASCSITIFFLVRHRDVSPIVEGGVVTLEPGPGDDDENDEDDDDGGDMAMDRGGDIGGEITWTSVGEAMELL